MKRKKVQPATSDSTEPIDTRARRRAIERWENEGGSTAPTEQQNQPRRSVPPKRTGDGRPPAHTR